MNNFKSKANNTLVIINEGGLIMHDLKCQAMDCLYNESKVCKADAIKIENDTSCKTYMKDTKANREACHCD